MKGTIYKITCRYERGSYIGKTKNPHKERWQEHKLSLQKRDRSSMHPNDKLRAIVRRHGINSLKFEVVEHCDPKILTSREIYWIAQCGSWNETPSQESCRRALQLKGSKPSQRFQINWIAIALGSFIGAIAFYRFFGYEGIQYGLLAGAIGSFAATSKY